MSSRSARPIVSPQFAVDAMRLLNAGDCDAALTLCEHGIALYPEYATGYLVIARAYALAGKPDAARSIAQLGLRHAPHSASLRSIAEGKDLTVANSSNDQDPESRDLARIAQSLEGARIPPIDSSTPVPHVQPMHAQSLVTPTLANIYEQQGLIDAAISAYHTLAAQHDESHIIYEEKIIALKKRKSERGI